MPTERIKQKLLQSRFHQFHCRDDEVSDIRAFTDHEVAHLIRQGNFASDWRSIRVKNDYNPEIIWNNFFIGEVVIGRMNENSGLYFSTLKNTWIGDYCFIKDAEWIENYCIDRDTRIVSCGEISFSGYDDLIVGQWIQATNEVKSRQVLVYEELDLEEAEFMARYAHRTDIRQEMEESVNQYRNNLRVKKGYIGSGVTIKHSGEIRNSFISDGTVIDNITALRDSVIWGSHDEPVELRDGVLVEKALIQWGCKVESMSIVSQSIMIEYSQVERHGKLTLSILGPNSLLGEGEITSSFCGPFIAMHHQSLLVAGFWAAGKGNMGYGANVGSNHTAKAPDQEIWIGEGVFWGLGVNIKYPCNLIKSPYSIIATGVVMLPQKIEMPFSLINLPSESIPGISPAYNEIMPAWVLSDDMFMILRNSIKYRKRDKARRNKFPYTILRREIMEMILQAREQLRLITPIKDIYTLSDIKAIGKNYLKEENRIKAIDTYSFYLKYYALQNFYQKVEFALNNQQNLDSLWQESDDPEYCFALEILKSEISGLSPREYCLEYVKYQEIVTLDVYKSKRKDDIRGREIIDDYESVLTLADDNEFIIFMREELKQIQAQVTAVIQKI